ncbi:AAA family ATPase [Bradyrhizobium sp. UFLA05-109]
MTAFIAPQLLVLSGLPGTGKTTLARELTRQTGATYLRIDAIEQSLRAVGVEPGAHGYAVANALAFENLTLGRVVVADCVNPVLASRRGWRATARRASVRIVEIELICSDLAAHRGRVEARVSDIEGLIPPTWDEVVNRSYEAWDRDHLILDTADGSTDSLVARILQHIGASHRDE